MSHPKLYELAELAVQREGPFGGRLVLCSGDFDLLHPEAIRVLENARTHGDRLVVVITPDASRPRVTSRPVVAEGLRAEALTSLTCVDAVVIGTNHSAMEAIRVLKPATFLPCREKRGGLSRGTGVCNGEEKILKALGVEILEPPANSRVPHHHQNPLWAFPQEVDHYLDDLAATYDAEAVLDRLSSVRDLKVLVVGESIVDEYHYCQTLGKSGKEPILATKFLHAEIFAGGALAVVAVGAARHPHAGLHQELLQAPDQLGVLAALRQHRGIRPDVQ